MKSLLLTVKLNANQYRPPPLTSRYEAHQALEFLYLLVTMRLPGVVSVAQGVCPDIDLCAPNLMPSAAIRSLIVML